MSVLSPRIAVDRWMSVAVVRALAPIPVCALALAVSWFAVFVGWDIADELGVGLALAVLTAVAVVVGQRTRFGLVWGAGCTVGGGAAAFVALTIFTAGMP